MSFSPSDFLKERNMYMDDGYTNGYERKISFEAECVFEHIQEQSPSINIYDAMDLFIKA